MKSLADDECRRELLRRLRSAKPESERQWGRMTAHQMICHLGDSFRMALDQKRVSDASSLTRRTLIKWMALYLPVQWRTGILTVPEVDQEIGGTRPVEFAADVKEAEALLMMIASRSSPCTRSRFFTKNRSSRLSLKNSSKPSSTCS